MKQIFTLLSLVAIGTLMILMGLVGYLMATGKLNTQSASLMAAALRGEKLVQETSANAPATQPTSRPAASKPADEHFDIDSVEMKLALLDREARLIQDRTIRLKDAELKLIQDRKSLSQNKSSFTEQVKLQEKASEDEGFTKALTYYTQLPPKLAKEDFMKLELNVVVRYLNNMTKMQSAKILKEFKTPEEQQRRQEIIERTLNQKVDPEPLLQKVKG
jgi:hypothetical protein